MSSNILLNSIYLATEGEGVFIGRPQVFVRLQGCNIGCANCDSKETWDFDHKTELAVEEVLKRVEDQSTGSNKRIDWISITGGDPLNPKHKVPLLELIHGLKNKNYKINIEASGNKIDAEIFNLVDFVSFDFKTPSTQVRTSPEHIVWLGLNLKNKFQIKSVVQDKIDFMAALKGLEFVKLKLTEINFDWVLTPVYNVGESFPIERFQFVQKINQDYGGPFRVIGQQHKWIYGPDRKQV